MGDRLVVAHARLRKADPVRDPRGAKITLSSRKTVYRFTTVSFLLSAIAGKSLVRKAHEISNSSIDMISIKQSRNNRGLQPDALRDCVGQCIGSDNHCTRQSDST
ncbi:hypothetical protein [Burkholderia territorii]|uniref:hypothetical protein n=1 Tax=Burkholderia territorii TaxID=1503055 RepID=UPI0012D970AA|nr:hypothetical protein [Burkholderia territorii]